MTFLRRAPVFGVLLAFAALAAQATPAYQTAIFAGGCFWTMEHQMEVIPGVVNVVSGYTGGPERNPTYAQVSSETTGHRESVRVTFDPARITYAQLVARYFRLTDPTDAYGQFCDHGPSYRPAVFVADAAQRAAAEAAKAQVQAALHGRVVATQILPAQTFWPAEAYHQDFVRRNPVQYAAYSAVCGRDATLRRVWGS